jgi:hypothetical protein
MWDWKCEIRAAGSLLINLTSLNLLYCERGSWNYWFSSTQWRSASRWVVGNLVKRATKSCPQKLQISIYLFSHRWWYSTVYLSFFNPLSWVYPNHRVRDETWDLGGNNPLPPPPDRLGEVPLCLNSLSSCILYSLTLRRNSTWRSSSELWRPEIYLLPG